MKKNLMWNTCGSIFYSLCQWIMTIIVVHIASYQTAGVLSLAMTTSSSFSAISLFSMRNYQVSDMAGEYSSGQYVSSRIWTCALSFILCCAYSIIGNSTEQILAIIAFMIIRVAEAYVDVMHGVDQKYDRYDLIGKSYLLRGMSALIIFFGGMLIFKNLVITLYCIAIVNLLIAGIYDRINTGKLETILLKLRDKKILKLLINCAPLVVFTFLLSLENLIPKNVLQYYYGTELLGIYSSIASPTLIVQLFASVVFAPFLPIFSKLYYEGEKEKLKNLLHKTYLAFIVLSLVVIAGAVILGKWGLQLLFGSNILKHYYLFLPMVLCTLCTGIIWVLSAIVIMFRKIKQLLVIMLFDFLLCVALVFPIVAKFGANGCSIVQLVTLPILILAMIIICEVET